MNEIRFMFSRAARTSASPRLGSSMFFTQKQIQHASRVLRIALQCAVSGKSFFTRCGWL